jgi:hypothetical protein
MMVKRPKNPARKVSKKRRARKAEPDVNQIAHWIMKQTTGEREPGKG